MITVEQLWAEKYAPLLASATAFEDERRAEDFLDVSRTVCGLELRPLTPRDFLILDYAKNPLLCGGEVQKTHVAQFLFHLHAAAPLGWLSERRFFRHCATLDLAASVAEIHRYLERIFADCPATRSAPGPQDAGNPSERPIGTHFLAPLIVRLASGIPGLSPSVIMETPLPQLFQYQKVLAAESAARTGGKQRNHTLADRLLSECLDEANRLNAAGADPASQLSALNSQPVSP